MRNYEVIDRYGNRVERDGDEELRDGERLRVPLHMADSRQREVTEHFERLRAEDAAARSFGHEDGLALHRPGQRFSVDEAARARVEQAYQDSKRELQDAWRKPVADAAGEFRGAQPGDVCTINGAPGHLDHQLQCVPDKRSQDSVPRVMDAASAQKIRDEAWLQSVREEENEWRRPAR